MFSRAGVGMVTSLPTVSYSVPDSQERASVWPSLGQTPILGPGDSEMDPWNEEEAVPPEESREKRGKEGKNSRH